MFGVRPDLLRDLLSPSLAYQRKARRMSEADDTHLVEMVQRDRRAKGDDAAYWRCSCGQSAGGRWYGSAQEAAKAADRHLDRAGS